MSKKQKNVSTVQKASPFKIVLPILIGLLAIGLITTIIALATRPQQSAKVDNPNEVFVTIGDYKITNQQMYETLRSQHGVTKLTEMIDADLLKDVTYTEEQKTEIINKLIYGEDEDMDDEEKAEALKTYKENLAFAGYITDEQVAAYEDLLIKRSVFAEQLYEKWIDKNDFDAEEYEAAYLEKYADKYTSNYSVIYVTFDTENQAKELLKHFGVDTTVTSAGWVDAKVAEELKINETDIKNKDAEVTTSKAAYEAETDEAKKEELKVIYEGHVAALDALKAKKVELEAEKYLDPKEVALTIIKMYNYMNAYYLGGDVATYFDAEGNLLPAYELIKEGVHYTIESVDEVVDAEGKVTCKAYSYVKFNKEELAKLNEVNENIQFTFTSSEAAKLDKPTDSNPTSGSFTSVIMTTLEAFKDLNNYQKAYNPSAKKFTSGRYFYAYKFDAYTAEVSPYDFSSDAAEDKKPSAELMAELKTYLLEETFDDNVETQMLLYHRQENGLKIYDRFLNVSYKSAYVYLHEKTLGMASDKYTAYAEQTKSDKKLAFEYNGKQVSANDLFVVLANQYVGQDTLSFVSSYALLNSEFNEIYNPFKDEILDRNAYAEKVSRFEYVDLFTNGQLKSVKEFKFAFENGIFASYGFEKDYGWNNFVRDYLLQPDTDFLAGSLCESEANDNYINSLYNQDAINAEMKAIYDAYYSLKVVNLLVSVDYNNDSQPDEFVLEEGEEQTSWTEYQQGLVQEFIDAIYAATSTVEKDTIYDKLTEVVNQITKASPNDATWGKYIRAGLRVKAESAQDYTSASSLVQEFHDEMAKIYLFLEESADFALDGKDFTTPYSDHAHFPTVYGYHKVAVLNADARITVDGKESTDLTQLTLAKYEKYLEMKQTGYVKSDDDLSEAEVKAFDTYFAPAITNLYTSNWESLQIITLREKLFNDKQIVFANEAHLTEYVRICNLLKASVEEAIAEENAE